MAKKKPKSPEQVADVVLAPLYLDFGCGPNPRVDRDPAGNIIKTFEGVDRLPFSGKVKHVFDVVAPIHPPIPKGFEWMADVFERRVVGHVTWPWDDSSVDEANASHFLEHITNFGNRAERVHFFNELYRILKHDAKATIVLPHWASQRYYGDPTHKEPFSEFGWYYLDKNWRAANAPHADGACADELRSYRCDFGCQWGYALDGEVGSWPQERQAYAMKYHKESCLDQICTLACRKPSP